MVVDLVEVEVVKLVVPAKLQFKQVVQMNIMEEVVIEEVME
jgi:hypothetical protein